MAYTSKRAYRLAISHVFTSLRWSRDMYGFVPEGDSFEAYAMWQYMRAPEPVSQVPRVQHLHHFVTEFFQLVDVPLLHQLLGHASNLRTIELWHFGSFVTEEDKESLSRAIGAMRYLKQAFLLTVPFETISLLPVMFSSSTIASLTLELGDSDYEPDHTAELTELVSVLASTPSIYTFTVDFNRVPVLPNAFRTPYGSLPSIRHLSLTCSLAVATSFVTLCPNLLTLSLWLYGENPIFSLGADDRWPTDLKELIIRSQSIVTEDTARPMGRVSSVSLGCSWASLSGPEILDLLPLLEATRPFALKLQTIPVLTQPEYVWKFLGSAVPRLRSLEVAVTRCKVCDYVDSLLPALQASGLLLHLTLHFPPPTHSRFATSMAEVDDRRATEVRRVEALLALPPRLVTATPSLRLVALRFYMPASSGFDTPQERAERVPTMSAELAAELAREDDVERRWGLASEFVRPALRRLRELRGEVPRDERWWWVGGTGAARRPVEIWREDGEGARALIECADFDAAREPRRVLFLEVSI
ncbi:uncharacterized protein BXZ73DRAFT_110454 [Epithele typhae]|uniref:uncharacterized protein n=1 Tax=Epithele typhae TaxID=378194 RepID=UPI002008AD6B|nr:uncharacterized protein BXZ73DRAFT_110454 [Epithele typhae]KAH9906592.1 hypothetical protein BXZ73DRAFT_110454 [Epithele typhae]